LEYLDQHIESLIFTSNSSITIKEIQDCLFSCFENKFSKDEVLSSIKRLQEKYEQNGFAMEIVNISQGYRFMTKAAYHTTVGQHLKLTNKKRLSKAALETLSIVAYKQPVTRVDMEHIRGVNCDYTIQKLLEKELVEIHGRSDAPGKPLLYKTSKKFMDYFGIGDLNDLPKLKDFKVAEEVGEPAPIEEETKAQESQTPQNVEEQVKQEQPNPINQKQRQEEE